MFTTGQAQVNHGPTTGPLLVNQGLNRLTAGPPLVNQGLNRSTTGQPLVGQGLDRPTTRSTSGQPKPSNVCADTVLTHLYHRYSTGKSNI